MRRLLFAVAAAIIDRVFSWSSALRRVLTVLKYKCAFWWVFESRSDDIFVVAYPKAGTTALQMMLYQMKSTGDMNFAHIDAVVPWFEVRLSTSPRTINRLPSPRIFKTHLSFKHLPTVGRFLYAVRNPKDSCVSYYHHHVTIHSNRSSLSEFVQQFVTGGLAWGSWFTHFRESFPHRGRDQVLLLPYDDLSRNLEGVVDRVAAFCGFTLDEAHRTQVLERCSFAFMKQHNDKFDPRLATNWKDRPAAAFIRKGAVGDWSTEMSPGDSALLEERLKQEIARLGEPLSDHERAVLHLGRS